MSTDRFYPFSVGFSGSHGTREFASADELEQWLSQEDEVFRGIAAAKLLRSEEPLSGLLARLQGIRSAKDHLAQAKGHMERQEQQQYDAAMSQVRKRLNAAYTERGIPPSQSLEVQALRPYAEQDPTAALAALHCLCEPQQEQPGGQLTLGDRAIVRGLGIASFIRYQLFGQSPNEPAARVVDATVASVNARADKTHAELSQQIAQAREVNERLKQAWDTRDDEFAKLSSKLSSDVDAAINDAKSGVDSFKNSYQAEIALKEPVTFWTEKAIGHAKSSRNYGIAALLFAIASAAAAGGFLPSLLSVDQSGHPPYYGIAIAVAVTTLSLWLLRVLVRNYLAQSHLKADADERVAMVKTYLALMESGKAPSETLGPVLIALFRPASDGLVKDDSMPVSVAELLTRSK